MPSPWRVAKSLLKLRAQINEAFPNRDKTSDGTIGDAAHASRKSDHNPWVKDSAGVGVVTGMDIDEDLNGRLSLQRVVDNICASRDNRVKYIIYEGRITVKGSQLQEWKRYTGPNPHNHHAHISVESDPAKYDNESGWFIEQLAPVALIPVDPQLAAEYYIVKRGDTLWGIARKFATSVEEIKRFNTLKSDIIKIEQKLRVR